MENDFTISKRLLSIYLGKIGLLDDSIHKTSLKSLVGEAMYFERVIDDYDWSVMMTHLDEYMGNFILDINPKFYFIMKFQMMAYLITMLKLLMKLV